MSSIIDNIFPSLSTSINYDGLLIERILFDFRRGLPVFLDYQGGYFLKPTEFIPKHKFETHKITLITGDTQGNPIFENIDDAELISYATELLKLIKLSELSPSLGIYGVDDDKLKSCVTRVTLDQLKTIKAIEYTVEKITGTHLPISETEQCRLLTYRIIPCFYEYYVMIINNPDYTQPVNLRLHAECFTGDILGSLRCDCQPQLYKAIQDFSQEGHAGVIVYVRQEGRNIGLLNKLRAYELQNQGHDTVDANLLLGFTLDERDYTAASLILKDLGIKRVNILTNNPEKIQALEANGIEISHRVAHYTQAQKHNATYMQTKKNKIGHLPE